MRHVIYLNSSKSLFVPPFEPFCCLAQHTKTTKRQRHCSRVTKYTVQPAAPAAEEATSQPLQGLVGSDAPTNLQIPDPEERGTTFSPSPPHASFASSFDSSLRNPSTEQSLLRRCCDKLPQTTNSLRSVCTMAPPPTSEIPLLQRLQRVASTLQCTCAIAAPDAAPAPL